MRIGNAAFNQLQLDIYGEVLDSIFIFDKHGDPISYQFLGQHHDAGRMGLQTLAKAG